MDLFDVLSMDERVIVFSSEEERCFYTWNQSSTLQCWQEKTSQVLGISYGGDWEECGIQTLSTEPHNRKEARAAAIKWYCGPSCSQSDSEKVIIQHTVTAKKVAKMFGISKKRQKKLDKVVKKILKRNKKR